MLKLIKTLIVIHFMMPFYVNGQSKTCNCTENLQYMIEKVSKNYAGFNDKVTPSTSNEYKKLIDTLLYESKKNQTETTCYVLLKKYKAFFKDGHLQINHRSYPFSGSAVKSSVPAFDVDHLEVLNYLEKYKDIISEIEGIWVNADQQNKVAIIKNHNSEHDYIGVLLETKHDKWKPGMIKFEIKKNENNIYEGTYFRRDFASEKVTFKNSKNIIDILGFEYWNKIYPATKNPINLEAFMQQKNIANVYFKEMNNGYSMLRIGSFDISMKAVLEDIIEKNQMALYNTENLIIDIRDNAGGAEETFRELLKLLYTNPYYSAGTSYLATDENIQKDEEILEKYKPMLSKNMIKDFEELLEKGRKNIGQMVHSKPDSLVFNKILHYPQKVSVVINKKCYSSAEQFVYLAKQSKKVKVFGENTGGVMDYGDVRVFKMPYSRYSLGIATTRSGWVDYAPIDNVGFEPDIRIPQTESNWINYIQEYWKNTKKQ
ncbi:MAG: hypothetical protein KA313_09720 [Pseudarcicella sp.]|nr:hypothetical protein [Pseudarcicella sp.]MBP6411366.1 hypothetical protein [Pseudarcicella sp.]